MPFPKGLFMKQLVRNVLAVAVIALCANAAQADPVRLNWTTTIFDPVSIPNLSGGNAVTLTFEFNVAGGNLSNARLNATNFVSYSFTLFDGRSATADLVGPGSTGLLYPANDFFVFDALGDLQEVQQFGIRDESMSSNVAAWNGALGILYNNGANRVSAATAPSRYSISSSTYPDRALSVIAHGQLSQINGPALAKSGPTTLGPLS